MEGLDTQLTPEEEKDFQRKFKQQAKKRGMNENPDDPQQHYDYRGAYLGGVVEPGGEGHWPSEFKYEGHPNRFVTHEGHLLDTKEGKVLSDSRMGALERLKNRTLK